MNKIVVLLTLEFVVIVAALRGIISSLLAADLRSLANDSLATTDADAAQPPPPPPPIMIDTVLLVVDSLVAVVSTCMFVLFFCKTTSIDRLNIVIQQKRRD